MNSISNPIISEKTNAGLMIDLENLHYSAYQIFKDRQFKLSILLDYLNQRFNLIVKKAYACSFDESMQPYIHECMINGIELVNCIPTRIHDTRIKNSIDIRMAVDIVSRVYTDPNINVYIIASGDGDFVPVISHVREHANRVIIVGFKDSTNKVLIANCDEFIELDALIENSIHSNKIKKSDNTSRRKNNRKVKVLAINTSFNADDIKKALSSTLLNVKDLLVFGLNIDEFKKELIQMHPHLEQILLQVPLEELINKYLVNVKIKEENGIKCLYLTLNENSGSTLNVYAGTIRKETRRCKKNQECDNLMSASSYHKKVDKSLIKNTKTNWYTNFWSNLPSKKERIRFFNLVFNYIAKGKLDYLGLKSNIQKNPHKRIQSIQTKLYEALFYTFAVFWYLEELFLRDWITDIMGLEEHFVAFWLVFHKLANEDFEIKSILEKLEQSGGLTSMQNAVLIEPSIFLLRLGVNNVDELINKQVLIP